MVEKTDCGIEGFCFVEIRAVLFLHSQRDSDNEKENSDLIYLTNWLLFRKGAGGKRVKNSVKNNGQFKIQYIGVPCLACLY